MATQDAATANNDHDDKTRASALAAHFQLERVLNQDQAGRCVALAGAIDGRPALLLVERAPLPADDEAALRRLLRGGLARLRVLGVNDVYSWGMACSSAGAEDLKLSLTYPCTEAHVAKYVRQGMHCVVETPALYATAVRPYMQAKRDQGRLNWVFNIIEGRDEVDDVIFRTPLGDAGDEGFLLLPDLNWDRHTLEALHLLALVERRDMWSLRDLRKKHVPWLEHMKSTIVATTVATYPFIEPDQLKLYVHYQPTYYHLHVHVVHVALEAGATQATGKAVGLDAIVETLRAMAGDGEAGLDGISMTYTLGERSELWADVFAPLKTERHTVSR